jgi:hypothetical protein
LQIKDFLKSSKFFEKNQKKLKKGIDEGEWV